MTPDEIINGLTDIRSHKTMSMDRWQATINAAVRALTEMKIDDRRVQDADAQARRHKAECERLNALYCPPPRNKE